MPAACARPAAPVKVGRGAACVAGCLEGRGKGRAIIGSISIGEMEGLLLSARQRSSPRRAETQAGLGRASRDRARPGDGPGAAMIGSILHGHHTFAARRDLSRPVGTRQGRSGTAAVPHSLHGLGGNFRLQRQRDARQGSRGRQAGERGGGNNCGCAGQCSPRRLEARGIIPGADRRGGLAPGW
jgi:hypothetical protein